MTGTEVKIVKKTDRDFARENTGVLFPNKNYVITEPFDNSKDEHSEGYGNVINISLKCSYKDGKSYEDIKKRELDKENGTETTEKVKASDIRDVILTVQDFGRGLPVGPCDDEPDVSQAERALSSLHAGGKFGKESSYTAKTGGMNGIGIAGINFMSRELVAFIKKKDGMYSMIFEDGIIQRKLEKYTGPNNFYKEDETGTTLVITVDEDLWDEKSEDFDMPQIVSRLKAAAYLNPRLTINVDMSYNDFEYKESLHFKRGIENFVEDISNGDDFTEMYHLSLTSDDIDIEFAFKYTESSTSANNILVFTNDIEQTEGGHHLRGVKDGIYHAMKDYYLENNMKNSVTFESEDCRDGLFFILSIKVANPNFEGQGKNKLNMPKVRGLVKEAVYDYVMEILDKDPNIAKLLINKILEAARNRESLKKAREAVRKTKSLSSGTVKGLTKCHSNNSSECELFLVEGDSAGGSAKAARDKRIQAILPVFGKVNNTEGSKMHEILKSTKIMEAVKALGCGIGKEFDIDKLRYDKIIILADGDVDGLHIQTLWLTFFYLHMKELVDEGHFWLARPPLYLIKMNKEKFYLYSEDERIEFAKVHAGQKMDITRFKGLGEMKAEELWDSTMDPKNRVIEQIDSKDIASSLEAISLCMGDDIPKRREFLMDAIAKISDEDIY